MAMGKDRIITANTMIESAAKVLIFLLFAVLFIIGLLYLNHLYRFPKFYLTHSISFSSDGKLLAASTNSKSFLWNVEDGRIKISVPSEDYESNCAISPDNRFFAGAIRGSFSLYRTIDGGIEYSERKKTIFPGPIAFSPDSRYVVYFPEILLTDKLIHKNTFNDVSDNPASCSSGALSGEVEGGWYVIMGANLKALYNIEKGEPVKTISFSGGNEQASRTGGNRVFVFTKHRVSVIDMRTSEVKDIDYDEFNYRLEKGNNYCVSNDGKLFALAYQIPEKPVARVYDVETGKMTSSIPLKEKRLVEYVAIHSKNRMLAVGYQAGRGVSGKIVLYGLDSKKEIKTMEMR